MKSIMVDMDDVITDGDFETFLEEFLNQKIDFSNSNFYFRQELIEGQEDEFRERYANKNLYENSPLLDGCFEVLKKLNEKYDVYIVTSYIWNKYIFDPEENLKNKYNYLKEKLPFIDPRKYIFADNKKIMNFDIRIDDRLSGLQEGSQNLLFDSWSNRRISDEELKRKNITRVLNWYDIEKILL